MPLYLFPGSKVGGSMWENRFDLEMRFKVILKVIIKVTFGKQGQNHKTFVLNIFSIACIFQVFFAAPVQWPCIKETMQSKTDSESEIKSKSESVNQNERKILWFILSQLKTALKYVLTHLELNKFNLTIMLVANLYVLYPL